MPPNDDLDDVQQQLAAIQEDRMAQVLFDGFESIDAFAEEDDEADGREPEFRHPERVRRIQAEVARARIQWKTMLTCYRCRTDIEPDKPIHDGGLVDGALRLKCDACHRRDRAILREIGGQLPKPDTYWTKPAVHHDFRTPILSDFIRPYWREEEEDSDE